MPRKLLGEFSVEWMQVLDETGKADPKLMPKELTETDMLHMYEYMVATRIMDDKLFKLQRQGRSGTIGQSLGQEACAVGSAYALNDEDWTFPAFREHGMHIVRHYPIYQYMQYWGGDERGGRVPPGVNVFTIAIPVASQIPHAVGLAWAMKMRKKSAISVVYFGDGGTSRGDFHEGMNFAGTFNLPIVFICQNNQWAISLPVERQTASKTLAQKAIAYGFNGIRVDGNDIFAVYKATKEAADNARAGKGPTLIECLTYRMADHTTSDDAKKYRNPEEVEKWKKKDPITRLEKYLLAKEILTVEEKDKIRVRAESNVEAATKKLETLPAPDPEDMFKFTFENMTPEMKEQMEEMRGFLNGNTDNSASG